MTTTTSAALGRLHHHHHHQPQASGVAREFEADAQMIKLEHELEPANRSSGQTQTATKIQTTTTTTIKHERISLKKLHSLRNQLFCGFKSFSSSNEQPERRLVSSKAQVEAAHNHQQQQQHVELPRISKPDDNNDKLNAALEQHFEHQQQQQQHAALAKLEDCNSAMMIVDHQLQNASLSASGGASSGLSNRTSRGGSKSSSWASLTTSQQQREITSDQQQQQEITRQLAALLTSNGSNYEDSRAAGDGSGSGSKAAAGCSLKRASFRRLTGRTARSKQARQSSEEQQQQQQQQSETMLKLIKQLDRISNEINCGNKLTNENEGIFYLESSWTSFVHLDKIQADDCCCCLQTRDRQPNSHKDTAAAAAAKCPSAHLKSAQQDAIWELLTSEVFYLRRLRVMIGIFLETLAKLQRDSLLLDIDPVRLASNIEEIYLANYALWTKHLLPMLMRSRLTGCPLNPGAMKQGFVQIACLFDAYSRYCLEHRACLDYLRDTSKHDQYFKLYLEWCESQKDCERLRLMDLLAKPMQRLTKYPLLLKAICRRTDDPKKLADLKEMSIGMEKFVLTVDLRLHDHDELEQLSLTANRIESLDIGSSDSYCDEAATNNYCLGQIKFKDSQLNSKQDVVLLLFTDQLLVCRQQQQQASHRWYSGSGSGSQERSPASSKSFKSPIRQQHRGSIKSANSATKAASWIKSRSGSGNHLVDSLILANNNNSRQGGALLSAHTGSGSGRHSSFHLSSSSLAGSAAREHFVVSKSAEGSRSGESFVQQSSPSRPPQRAASSRLRAIRSPYPIDRLVLHELNDGNRILCCQLNDSGTIAASFVLHVGSTSAELLKSKADSNSNNSPAVKLTSAANTLEFASAVSAPEQSTMHHLSPLSGLPTRSGGRGRLSSGSQHLLSPARRLVNLVEQTQLRYKTAASFHGIQLANMNAFGDLRQQELQSADNCEVLNWSSAASRRDKLDSSPTRSISSVSRSSELHFGEPGSSRERPIVVRDDENGSWFEMPPDAATEDSAADLMKVVLEEEQSMLLKHGQYDELQTAACRMDPRLAPIRQQQCLGQTGTLGSFASPFLSVSSNDEHRPHVQCANSQNSVFEPDRRNVDSQTDESPSAKTFTDLNQTIAAQTSDRRRRGQSWSCYSADRKQLTSISGSDIESTASDVSPLAGGCLSLDQTNVSRRGSKQRTATATTRRRRQVNHLRRQNDIVSFSHDQQETQQASGYSSYEDSTLLFSNDLAPMRSSVVSIENSGSSFELPLQPVNETAESSQHRRYLSLARRLMMQEQNQAGSSQATTMDLASMTLNDNQTELSLDSAEVEAAGQSREVQSRAVSIELGNLRSRMSFCAPTNQQQSGTTSQPASSSLRETAACRLQARLLSEGKMDHDHHQYRRRRSRSSTTTTLDNKEEDGAANGSSAFDHRAPSETASNGFNHCHTEGLKLSRRDSSSDPRSLSKNDDGSWNDGEPVIDPLDCPNNAPDQHVSVPLLNVTSADSPHLTDLESLDAKFRDLNKLDRQQETCASDVSRRRRPSSPEVGARDPRRSRAADDWCCLQPAGASRNQRISMSSAGGTNMDEFNDFDEQQTLSRREKGSLDGEQASISYKGNLLELQCIHKLIHQDEAQCGRRVYLGFYEKLDLHLKQTAAADSKMVGCTARPPDYHATSLSLGSESNHANLARGRHKPAPAGRASPARSDSSASKKVRSIRVFTNDLIGSLMRATSSCSVNFSKN